MVRAILDGRKTQTRRIVRIGDHGRSALLRIDGSGAVFGDSIPDDPVPVRVRCPYGQPGDRLWVRETWATLARIDGAGSYAVAYRASCQDDSLDLTLLDGSVDRWRPSIFMPRWASRISLELTAVRVERLQDISANDARAEGIESEEQIPPAFRHGPRKLFAYLWDEINAKRAPWDSNPWVWALTFRKVD